MLKLLRRKKVSKRILYVLAAIIIPAFVVWGSASVMNKNKVPDYAGMIFGKKVSYEDFRQAALAWKTQIRLQYGEKAQEAMASYFNPNQAAWDRLIFLHETKKRKVKVSDTDVINTIAHISFLQRDGRFDPKTYDLFIKYSLGVQPRTFEEQLRQNLAMAKVYEEVTAQTKITEDDIKKEYEQQNVQTKIKYVSFPKNGYKDKVAVTEEEIAATYEKSKDTLKIPPQINVQYLSIDFKEGMPESEKTNAREKIKTASLLAKTKGLTQAAQETGLEIKETGLFGFEDPIPTLGWMPQLSQIFFDLQPQSLSKPIELNRGIYLFKIKEKKEAHDPELNEAKEKIKEILLIQKSKQIASQKAKEFLKAIKTSAASFENTAQAQGLTIKETPLFAREGYIPELGMAQSLKDEAFKLSKDAVGENPIELEQGLFCIKSLETPAFNEEKYKKEKDEFSKQLLEQRRNKVFGDFFEDLKKQAHLINYIQDEKIK